MQLTEAATIKAQAKALLKAIKELLGQKALPKDLHGKLDDVSQALSKNWADLETSDAAPAAATEAQRDGQLSEASLTHRDSENLVRAAIKTQFGSLKACVYVRDMADDWAVYDLETSDVAGNYQSATYQVAYVIDAAGKVTLGDPIKVLATTVYVPITEALAAAGRQVGQPLAEANDVELAGDVIPLVERAVRKDGTVPLKIITPGWGSSGYYAPEVLKRDGPALFKAGTKMYWDHPTVTEEAERPERSLRDLAAEFVTDATWQEAGQDGPGLYADATVFGPYREALAELAPHIGVSINALGKAKLGKADGKTGPIIEKIVAARSVDFVTTPGAGGKVLELFEAARGATVCAQPREAGLTSPAGGQPAHTPEERAQVDEQEAKALKESNQKLSQDLARLQERELLREARDIVRETLASIELPAITRTRLAEQLSQNPPVKDGALDAAALTARIQEAAKAEVEYLASVTGSGRITGMGTGGGTPTADGAVAKLTESLKRLGLDEAAAKHAAQGR